MKINIQSLSFHANEKLTDFTVDKVNKLAQYTDRIIQAEVVLKVLTLIQGIISFVRFALRSREMIYSPASSNHLLKRLS
jgi:ribosome-associated translation inhibitor RaiA